MSLSPLLAAISVGDGEWGGISGNAAAATTMDPLYLPTANLVADNMISTNPLCTCSYVNGFATRFSAAHVGLRHIILSIFNFGDSYYYTSG